MLRHIIARLDERSPLMDTLSSVRVFITFMVDFTKTAALSTYRAVLAVNKSLYWLSYQRTLGDRPCHLRDYLGESMPLHLQFVNCWEAIDAVLEVRYRGMPGYDKIVNKAFVYRDRSTGHDIPRIDSNHIFLRPGQQIEILLRYYAHEIAFSNSAHCRSCLLLEDDTKWQW